MVALYDFSFMRLPWLLAAAFNRGPLRPDTLLFGVFESCFVDWLLGRVVLPGAGQLSGFHRWQASLGHVAGPLLNHFFLTDSERPFRGSTKRGGEDSCGGF